MREPLAMREIHEIRKRLYQEEKKITAQEKIAKIKKEAGEVIRKYGFKFKKHHSAVT